jgi:hypothetical protein
MAKNKVNNKDFMVLKELKKLQKINGQIRTVKVEINDPEVAKYAVPLDKGTVPGQRQNYHFSDGDGVPIDYFNDRVIKKSINSMVSGKRRPEKELDKLSKRMAKITVDNVLKFVEDGAHRNYQEWKGTNDENLKEHGKLIDSIVGVVYKKTKVIYRGR